MNKKIIQKIIDALNEGTPDKVMYAIGALDMILETLPDEKPLMHLPLPNLEKVFNKNQLDMEAMARLKNIKDIV